MDDLQLPESVKAIHIASARVKEIEKVKALLQIQNGSKLAFQKLPRHMRRRVMGHSTKRVPNRIKQIHQNQLEKSGLPPKQKRPSRKYRRRPQLLNSEITRRQRHNKWLETHIWHAKRFHMITKWSYKIPYRPTDKAFRAAYRATKKHCLLQDISYISCIELKGKQSYLIGKFKLITRTNEGLSMHAKAYINGNREGTTTFYTMQENTPIGNVTYNWKSSTSYMEESTIWIWAHAAFFQDVLNELIELFNLPDNKDGTYSYKTETVILTDLRYQLNRFRLTGPLSQAVLAHALKPVNASMEIDPWLKEYLEDDEQRQLFSEQFDYWIGIKDLQTPALLSPHIIFSLIITDPRFSMPFKRSKAGNTEPVSREPTPPRNLSSGAIWDAEIRKIVTSNKLSNAEINERRSQLLVPGTELNNQGAQVPVMFIQRPGISKTGYCAGWDLIIPKGWGQSTWMSLVMWGARAGGYRETESINFEMCQQSLLPPDTKAGVLEDAALDDQYRTRYFKLPPNKRTNYNKFSSASPLCFNWKILLSDWGTTTEEKFFVLRDKRILQSLQLRLDNRKHHVNIPIGNYLIPVKITLKRGLVSRYTMICFPKSGDLTATDLQEPKKTDIHMEERKQLRNEHKVHLQRLKRKRHLDRTKGLQVSIDKTISETFINKMRDLWLPKTTTGLRNSSSREIMGFVQKGGVSFSNGNSHGIGYVSLAALTQFLLLTKNDQVLCRNANSRQYRIARLEVIQ